jgi:ribosomal protein S13
MAEALAQERLTAASELADLQHALSGDPDMEEMRKRLNRLIQRVSLRGVRHLDLIQL